MLTTFTAPAFAGTWYIEDGDITISAGESGNNVTQNENTTKNDTDTIITNREEGASSHTVTIDAKDKDDKVEVTLKDVNIDTSKQSKAAVSVTGSGDTTIELDGDNELKSGDRHAGLEHNQTVDSEGNVTSGKLTIQDDNDNAGSLTATSGYFGAGIGGGQWGNGTVTISGDSKIESALGGGLSAGIGGGAVGNGTVSISGNATIENAQGGEDGAGIGGGYGYGQSGTGDITIEGNTTVNATGGMGSAGIGNGTDAGGNNGQITIRGTKDSSPTVNATGGIAEEDGQGYVGPGGAGIGGGSTTDSEYTPVTPQITLEGKVTIVAKAGESNAAIGDMNGEQVFTGLDGSITRYDSEGNDTTLPTDPGYPVPADTSSSGGGSAGASVQESVFPGLIVTDKDGQRISYTSIRGNNVLSLRVGRFTASLHASLSILRQLRAEGIDTITFQTILCSTTLSVDELLAMGGEDAEAVLTHRLTASSLTVG